MLGISLRDKYKNDWIRQRTKFADVMKQKSNKVSKASLKFQITDGVS